MSAFWYWTSLSLASRCFSVWSRYCFIVSRFIFRPAEAVAICAFFQHRARGRTRWWLVGPPGRMLALDFWRDNHTVEVIGLPVELKGRTYVKSKIRCCLLQNFAGR